MRQKKTFSLNIRFSADTEMKARALCDELKAQYGTEIMLSTYLRGVIETVVDKRFEELRGANLLKGKEQIVLA